MNILEFKAFVKSIFKDDKVTFKYRVIGTSFESDGTIIASAFIKKGWDFELTDDLGNVFIDKKILIGYDNDKLKLSYHTDTKITP